MFSSRAIATDPVTDLDCQLNGNEANLTWTIPSSAGPGSRHLTEVLSQNPIAFWRLGEASGSTAVDSQGLSNGVYTNGVTLGFSGAILDDSDAAVYFDGGDPFIDVPHDDAMLLDEGTVAFWFYPHRHDRRHGLFSKDSNGLDTGGHLTIYWDRSKIRTRLQSTSTSYFVSTGNLPDNTWYHVAFSWGSTGMRLYVNGVLLDTENYSGGLGSTSGGIGNFEPIVIGANGWSTGNLNSNGVRDELDGRMDEVAMFDTVLSAAEILALADAQVPEGYDYDVMAGFMNADGYWRFEETSGTTAADSAGANDGTYSASVVLDSIGAIPGSVAPDFDGVAAEVVADDPNSLQETEGNVSIACWFQAQASPGTIVSLGNPGNNESQNTLFEIEYAGDRFFYRHERSSASLIETEFLLGTTLNAGQWYHVALIKNENRRLLRFFLDGVEVGNDTFSSDEQGGEASDLYWGNNPTGSNPLDGLLDEALVFTRAIPEPYIRALASSLPGRAIRIERDGTEIDLLPGTATSFDDPGLATGAFEYCVTYLVDGVASSAECCTVTTLQPVSNLTCSPKSDSVTLNWQVTETYDAITVIRDGLTVATLGATATSYTDLTPPSGSVTYEVVGSLAGDDAPAAECTLTFSPSVASLTCTVDRDIATLDWINSAGYDNVDVLRDGVLVATLPGAVNQYVESGLLAGSYQFEVIGVIGAGSSVPTLCSATVIAEPTDVTCCSEGVGQVEVCWTDPVGYDAVEIYRDGTLVTTTTAPPCSFDTPGPGSYTYTLVGVVSGQASRESNCSALVLSPPTSLDCSQVTDPCLPPADVELSWTNNTTADSIQVLRDGVVVATLGGSATNYTDTALANGTYVYTVRPLAGACAAESSGCSIDVVSETIPNFTTQPSSQTVCPGTTIVFTVAADGTAPISFQWRKDGVDLAGETNASLVVSPVSAPDAGTYDVVANNGCGTTNSAAATLTVNTPASATVAGPAGGACDGDRVTLTASTLGTAPITVQWRKNGIDLAGETNATLTLSGVSAGDAGQYDVAVTNACGTEASDNSYALDVLVDAAVTSDPAPQAVCEGNDATFTIGVTGTEPVTVQWRKDGANIAGANGLSYTISGVAPSDAGIYDAVVSNDCASVTSAGAVLTVQTGASVSISGPSLACEGDSVVYAATTSGTAPVSVQWRKNGVDLPGETGNTLTLASATTADGASYTAVASNACNTDTSNAIALDVRVP
ncbi:MAG: LamG-like jellyroll fold domain-containing protein, partial [Planctomycetota bacterium]